MNENLKQLLQDFYNRFKPQFKSGEIGVVGSLMYKALGCDTGHKIKDIDLVIPDGAIYDDLVDEILKTYDDNPITIFTKAFNANKYSGYNQKIGKIVTEIGLIEIYRTDKNNFTQTFTEIAENIFAVTNTPQWLVKVYEIKLAGIKNWQPVKAAELYYKDLLIQKFEQVLQFYKYLCV